MEKKLFFGGNIKNNVINPGNHVGALYNFAEANKNRIDIAFAPTNIQLAEMARSAEGTPILVGPQTIHPEDKGASSGAVGGDVLKTVNPGIIIIGHSERRTLFGETSEMVAAQLAYIQRTFTNVYIVLCIGEPKEVRNAKEHIPFVLKQLADSIGVPILDLMRWLVLAYEPVWAIGAKPATPDQAQEMHFAIREYMQKVYGSIANAIRIIYGGAAAPDNIAGFMQRHDIDGALVGGFSLDPHKFLELTSNAIESV